MQDIVTDTSGKLLISKDTLLKSGMYTNDSYRNQKSKGKAKGRFIETYLDGIKFVELDSLPAVTRNKIIEKYTRVASEYTHLLLATSAMEVDCAPMAVEMTADILSINEPFIRSSIETYIGTHYQMYTWAYLDAGLNSDSVKGYAKQCALVKWMYDFVSRIRQTEPDARRSLLLIRSLRANVLTAISAMNFEIKIPLNDMRFNQWFDTLLSKMDIGQQPEDIIQIKRQGNANRNKITDEQLKIVLYWHKNGTNMSIANLYLKWVEYGRLSGWWLENGVYCPPTEARLYQILQPFKNPMALGKTDAITHRLNMLPTSTRELPLTKNHVWQIDGTAHNENVAFGAKGKVRQHIYAIKVMDTATLRMLGVASLIGVKEPFFALEEAIMMAIRESGYKPAIIQSDHGPSWKELERWCETMDIKLYPTLTGNARGKTIESMFNMFDNDITRFLTGYSGQNRTATQSINSKPSEKRETKGKQNARSASIAMEWLRSNGMKEWNERIIKTLERKACDKTPMEMWDEKESETPALSYTQLCKLCGTSHTRKLTIEGLDIQHENTNYLYFPRIKTSEERAFAADLYTYYPLDSKNENQLTIYILEGGKRAPVYDKTGRYLGLWELKETVKYTAGMGGSKEDQVSLNDIMALQYRVTEKAKDLITEIDDYVGRHEDFEGIDAMGKEMLTGKRREYTGRYDKSALLEEEINGKDSAPDSYDLTQNDIPVAKYKELVDPDTGEVYRVRIN